MQKRLTEKLKSERGASLSLALLLFMVCAVIGSIVLVAATTAAGRLSDMQQADQRYFSVQSAAHLLIDELDGQSYTMTREKDEDLTITYRYVTDAGGNTTRTKSESSSYSYYASLDENGTEKVGAGISRSDSILTEAFLDYAFGLTQSDFAGETAWAANFPVLTEPMVKTFSMEVTPTDESGIDTDAMTVNVTMTLNTDASVTFDITNGGSSPYTVQLKFLATKSDNKNRPDVTRTRGADSSFDNDTLTENWNIQSIRTTTITWELSEMR